jgi:hypothetical protein
MPAEITTVSAAATTSYVSGRLHGMFKRFPGHAGFRLSRREIEALDRHETPLAVDATHPGFLERRLVYPLAHRLIAFFGRVSPASLMLLSHISFTAVCLCALVLCPKLIVPAAASGTILWWFAAFFLSVTVAFSVAARFSAHRIGGTAKGPVPGFLAATLEGATSMVTCVASAAATSLGFRTHTAVFCAAWAVSSFCRAYVHAVTGRARSLLPERPHNLILAFAVFLLSPLLPGSLWTRRIATSFSSTAIRRLVANAWAATNLIAAARDVASVTHHHRVFDDGALVPRIILDLTLPATQALLLILTGRRTPQLITLSLLCGFLTQTAIVICRVAAASLTGRVRPLVRALARPDAVVFATLNILWLYHPSSAAMLVIMRATITTAFACGLVTAGLLFTTVIRQISEALGIDHPFFGGPPKKTV